MITAYHRPDKLSDALMLMARDSSSTCLMGGGTKINRSSPEEIEVVDLQTLALLPELGLGQIQLVGNSFEIGAAVSLQKVMDYQGFPEFLKIVLKKCLLTELTYNLRQAATVGGTIVTSTSRSAFSAVLLALDAVLEIVSTDGEKAIVHLGDYLAIRDSYNQKELILKVRIPSTVNIHYESVSRTPLDFSLVSAAVACWPSGRTRVVLGGYGPMPVLAMDGPDSSGSETAAREIFNNAEDEWASAAYRSAVAEILVKRLLSTSQETINERTRF